MGICGSAVRCCATPPMRDCRTSFGGDFTARSPRGSRRRRTIRKSPRASSRCTISSPASIGRRGGTPRSPPNAPTAVYAHVEAARLYSRALEAGRRLEEIGDKDLAAVHEALGDAWDRAGEFRKASEAYTAARGLVAGEPLAEAGLLLKRSRLEEKLGKYPQALRWAARARKALEGLTGPEAARQAAQSTAWYATVLQAEGRSNDAIRWAQRAIGEAEAVDDAEALGTAYLVMGWAYGDLGKEGVEPLCDAFVGGLPAVGQPGKAGGRACRTSAGRATGKGVGTRPCPTTSGLARSP